MNLTSQMDQTSRGIPRFGLRTIMLLVAASATWTSYFTGRASIQRDSIAIEAMHNLAPKLFIRQSGEYACLRNEMYADIFFQALEYQCYLPGDHKYSLHLAWSKQLSLEENPSEPEVSIPITAGRHLICLNQLQANLVVTVDGQEVMNVPRKRQVFESNVSMGADTRFQSQWYPLGKPLTLIRLIEGKGGPKRGTGFALWVDLEK